MLHQQHDESIRMTSLPLWVVPPLITLLIFSSCSHGETVGPNETRPTLESATAPGPYSVQILLEADGMRNGPDYEGATVYYPADAEPLFASIVIVPGWISTEGSIEEWGPFIASHGIVVMTIGSNSPATDLPPQRAKALLDAMMTLRQENSRADSPLNGRLDLTRLAVGGWSMGGGGAQLAAVLEPSLRAVVALCPWLLEPTESTLSHGVPVLILSGQWDLVAPPEEHADLHYGYTPTRTQKLLYEVRRGDHFVATAPDHTIGGLSYSNGEVGRVALCWLKVFLEGDEDYRSLLFEVPASASRYETNVEE